MDVMVLSLFLPLAPPPTDSGSLVERLSSAKGPRAESQAEFLAELEKRRIEEGEESLRPIAVRPW